MCANGVLVISGADAIHKVFVGYVGLHDKLGALDCAAGEVHDVAFIPCPRYFVLAPMLIPHLEVLFHNQEFLEALQARHVKQMVKQMI